MQEYFEPRIGRKIKMFSLDRKNNILTKEYMLRKHVACEEPQKESYFKKIYKTKKK